MSTQQNRYQPEINHQNLVESYPYLDYQQLVDRNYKLWEEDPSYFLHGESNGGAITTLIRRTVGVALAELHRKYANIDEIVVRICNIQQSDTESFLESRRHISKTLKAGNKWLQIIGLCSGEDEAHQEESITHYGMLWLVGKGYLWERTNKAGCKDAIRRIGRRTPLFLQSKLYHPLVVTILEHLKGGKSLAVLSYSVLISFEVINYRSPILPKLLEQLSISGDTTAWRPLHSAIQDDIAREKQVIDIHPRACDAGTPFLESPSFTPPQSTIQSYSIGSTASIRPSGISPAWKPAHSKFIFHANRNDVRGLISDCSTVSYSPSPPQALLVTENLFFAIKVYFEHSCRNMIFDEHGTLLDIYGAELHNSLCSDFDSYCFTATMFGRKSYTECCHALSKACTLVEQILRAEHPRTLPCFLEVFTHLIQTGLPELASILRDFVRQMSAKVTSMDSPWGQICQLLGELDSESLDQAMAEVWKYTTEIFGSELGMTSRLAVSVRLDYLKRVYGSTDYLTEERLLRDLLAQFSGMPSIPTPRVMLNLAHNLNRQGRHDEAEDMAIAVLLLLQRDEIFAQRILERIECKKIVSRSQFYQGKALAAEQTMREAIDMIKERWGDQHSWVLEFKNVLEGWLRGWGLVDAANTLRREVVALMEFEEA